MRRLLLAEPDTAIGRWITQSCAGLARITVCSDFQSAREQLVKWRPDALVTNLRLDDYNGLHLVLLGKGADKTTRCLLYTNRLDLYLIQEAQAAGAFFERTERLAHALVGYLPATLPSRDRRDARRYDRRMVARGGRRSADELVHLVHA